MIFINLILKLSEPIEKIGRNIENNQNKKKEKKN